MTKKFFRIVLLAFVVLSIACGVYSYFSIDSSRAWMSFAGVAFIALPFFLGKFFRYKRSYICDTGLMIFIFFAFQLGVSLSFYGKINYYDLVVHGASGIVFTEMGLCFYWLLKQDKAAAVADDAAVATIFSAMFSMVVASMWEIFEYLSFLITGMDSQNVAATGVGDTIEDMMICAAGTIIACIPMYLHVKGKYKSFLTIGAIDFHNVNMADKE